MKWNTFDTLPNNNDEIVYWEDWSSRIKYGYFFIDKHNDMMITEGMNTYYIGPDTRGCHWMHVSDFTELLKSMR